MAESPMTQSTLTFEMIKELNVIPLNGFRLAVPGSQVSISKSFEFNTGSWLGLLGPSWRHCLSRTFTRHS
jgi:hypothetical protein